MTNLRIKSETMDTKSTAPPQAIAMDIATGNWKAQAVRTFINSNIAAAMEKLCTEKNIFRSVEEIANEAGLNSNATYRLLRFLSTFDVCIEEDDDSKAFKLGPVGEVLTPNNPQSVADAVLWESSNVSSMVWNKLDQFMKTEKMVVKEAIGANDIWEYFEENPDVLALFQKAMTGYSNDEAFVLCNEDLAPTFDLTQFQTVCDLGGAEGTLVLTLAKRFPECNFIISDLPSCVIRINESSLPTNFSVEAADFLISVPEADAYLLKHIIHDWDDEQASTILRNILKANSKATVYVIEFGPMPGPNMPHISKGFGKYLFDFNTFNQYHSFTIPFDFVLPCKICIWLSWQTQQNVHKMNTILCMKRVVLSVFHVIWLREAHILSTCKK